MTDAERKAKRNEYERQRRIRRTPEQRQRAKEYQREYRRRHPEKFLASLNSWPSRNPDARRAEAAKSRYGLSLEQYDTLIAGKCALCDRKAAAVDHCHETGRVRGALCKAHNVALGQFGDDPELLEAAARYLREASVDWTRAA